MSTVAFTDNIPAATAKTGYLSGIIPSGSTDARLSVTDTGDVATNFYYRTPGQTVWTLITLTPSSSEEFWFVLTSVRTIEYYFDAGIIQLSVVDYKTFGSSSAPTTVFTDSTPGGTSGSPKTGDVSSGVSVGSTIGTFLFTNTGDVPTVFNVRKTGTTTYDQFVLNPMTSTERRIALTSARTIEYYFDASTITVKVVEAVATTTISLTDAESWLTMYGYIVGDSGDITSAQVRLCLDKATSEVNIAARKYTLLSLRSIDSERKNTIIHDGTIAHSLRAMENKGASRGLEQQSQRVSDSERNYILSDYKLAIMKLEAGSN